MGLFFLFVVKLSPQVVKRLNVKTGRYCELLLLVRYLDPVSKKDL